MELFDICDESGLPTGATVTRTKAHEEGILHRTVHIWVARRCDPYVFVLLQKRADNKDSFPGCYDTSAAGHITAGDEPLESALRELSEELGIQAKPEELTFIGLQRFEYKANFYGKTFHDNEVAFTYLYEEEVDIEKLTLQEEEVSQVKWCGTEGVYFSLLLKKPEYCVPATGLELVRQHYFPHCVNAKTKAAKAKIDPILRKYGSSCVIGFLNSIALINDSYKVTSRKDRLSICRMMAGIGITARSAENLSAEWYLHNVAYRLGIARRHSKDVDLDYGRDPRFLVRLASKIFEVLHL